MKPYWIIFSLLALGLSASARQKPAAQESVKTDAKSIVLASPDLKVEILKVELEQAQLKSSYQQYQAALAGIQKQFTDDNAKLADLEKQAFAAQKLSEADYVFDPNALTFTPKAKTAAAPSSKSGK